MITNDDEKHVLRGTLGIWPFAEEFEKGWVQLFSRLPTTDHWYRKGFASVPGGAEKGLGGEHSRKHFFVTITSGFSRFAFTDVAGYPHGVEDRDDGKSVLKSKHTCSSIHAGAPDQRRSVT